MNDTLIESFKRFYSDLMTQDWEQLPRLYETDVLFRDPVRELRGVVALREYFVQLCGGLETCRFVYEDELVTGERACVQWVMHYAHPRLGGGKPLSLRGATVLHLGERISRHEDYYDMGAMLYEHVPLLGSGVNWLKRRLG